jgi:hypothetical protein
MAADVSWANTVDRAARTEPGHRAAEDRFLKMADGDPKRAESLRKAHFKRMALKSVAVRKARKAARLAADAAQAAAEAQIAAEVVAVNTPAAADAAAEAAVAAEVHAERATAARAAAAVYRPPTGHTCRDCGADG